MIEGSSVASAKPPGGSLPSYHGGEDARATGWACLTTISLWLFAVLSAVVAWSPLVIESQSGLQGGDIYTYFLPLKAWYADRLCAGELALWNPQVGHGFPSLGESQTGVFYPFNLLFYRFLSLNAAFRANFLLHYVLAFGFASLFIRRLGFTLLESLLAAVVFVYGWFPARSSLEWAIVTGAWLPLALWGLECFLVEGRWRHLLAIQLALVMQLLAGHFNLAFITLLLLVLYAVLRMLFEGRPWATAWRRLVGVAGAMVLAGAIAAVQLVPSWELKSRSQRESAEFDAQRIGYGSIPWSYLKQVIQPWRCYPHVREPEFHREHFGDQNTNKVEAHLYFGLVPLGLGVIGVVSAALAEFGLGRIRPFRAAWVWLLIGLFGLTLATGWWVTWARALPGFGYFTGPGRYGILVQLAVSVLAARGLSAVCDWIRSLQSYSPFWMWTGFACAMAGLVYATESWTAWAGGIEGFGASLKPVRAGWVSHARIVGLVLSGLVVAFVLCIRRRDVLAAMFCLGLAWIDLSLIPPYVQDAQIWSESPIHLRDRSAVGGLLREFPGARVLARNQNAVSLCGVATTPPYLGIGPREYFAGPLRLPDDFHWQSSFSPQMREWLKWSGVTHVLAFDAMDDESLELIWAGPDQLLHGVLGRHRRLSLWLYKLRPQRGRAYWVPRDQARRALDPHGETPTRIESVHNLTITANQIDLTVQCDEEAVAILTDLQYPGWKVYVDGFPVQAIAGSVMRAVPVEPGTHQIRWVYRPRSLYLGLIATLLAITVTGVLVVKRTTQASEFGG